jgi:hypothetical protein
MRLSILFLIGLIILSCKSNNDDFNPFDDDFRFHNKINLTEYDTIWDTCGFWSFEHDNKKGLKTFYGFLFDEAVGKGFSIEIDKIKTINCDSLFYREDYNNILAELFAQNPINLAKLKPLHLGLRITDMKIVSDSIVPYKIEITSSDNKIFKAWLKADCDSTGQLIRNLYFINLKDKQDF